MSENLLGPASVQYNDLVGTSAADRSDHRLNTESLQVAIGLDTNDWSILSYSLYQSRGHVSISIYAANRIELHIDSFERWIERAGERGGAIPVTQFRVDWKGSLGEFIDLAFKRFDVHLTSRGFGDNAIELDVQAEEVLSVSGGK